MRELPTGEELASRRAALLGRIADSARRAGRDPAGVALLAVTKGHPADLVRRAARSGQTLFGENRVAEGARKIEAVRGEFPGLSWRLVGPLQSNKARAAVQWFERIETLDRERLATRLETLLAGEERRMTVLIEVNVGREASKTGVMPEDAARLAEAALACPHLDVAGLMAVPPYDDDAQKSRPFFAGLRELRDRLSRSTGLPLAELSMGMSHDFEVAVEEGATEVRVGTALFGPREPQ